MAQAMDVDTALSLFSIAGSLSSTLDLDSLLKKIGSAAEKLLDSEASAIMLTTDDQKSLYFKVASGDKAKALKTMTLPIGQGIGGWVAQHRKPEVVNSAQKDARFAGKFDKVSGFATRSLLCVPMIHREELVGVVEVLNKRKGAFTEEDVGLLSSLASLASVAIVNAKLAAEQKNFFSHMMELLTIVIGASKPGMEDHPVRAAKLACAIGRALGVGEQEYRMIYYAGILHDVGYVAFKNSRMLAEMGVQTPVEEMHPLFSTRMLGGIKMIEGALPAIRHHHERFDGAGYPDKLKGDKIPLEARILRLVEDVEELRMKGLQGDELYKKAAETAKAGSGKVYDPTIVEIFLALLATPEGLW